MPRTPAQIARYKAGKETAYRKAYYLANKETILARDKERAKQNVELRREQALIRKYGLTSKQWDALFEKQGHACGICRTTNPQAGKSGTGTWHADHSHSTDKTRGILCGRCNMALGLLQDSSALARIAAEYLDTHAQG